MNNEFKDFVVGGDIAGCRVCFIAFLPFCSIQSRHPLPVLSGPPSLSHRQLAAFWSVPTVLYIFSCYSLYVFPLPLPIVHHLCAISWSWSFFFLGLCEDSVYVGWASSTPFEPMPLVCVSTFCILRNWAE